MTLVELTNGYLADITHFDILTIAEEQYLSEAHGFCAVLQRCHVTLQQHSIRLPKVLLQWRRKAKSGTKFVHSVQLSFSTQWLMHADSAAHHRVAPRQHGVLLTAHSRSISCSGIAGRECRRKKSYAKDKKPIRAYQCLSSLRHYERAAAIDMVA